MPLESVKGRKAYLDNVRSFTILLVVIYHIAYTFNSAGVINNIPIKGIAGIDVICYFLYPWFMCLMFLTAGISARYSLQKRDARQFLKERVRKLIIPIFGGIFLLGWLNGWVTGRYVDMFGGNAVPGIVKYLVYCLNIGPLWFLLELFAISMILLVIRRIDRKDRLSLLSSRAGMLLLILLVLPVWGSSYILNPPLVSVFRNGIYWLMFLLGYYIFSNDAVLEKLKRYGVGLMVIAVILGIIQVCYFFGQNYTSDACLQHPLTNLYLWIMILAILGCSQKFLNFSNNFTEYLRKNNFKIYVCHYPIQITAAYLIITYMKLPILAVYLILLPVTLIVTVLFYETAKRIPVISFLLFGKD